MDFIKTIFNIKTNTKNKINKKINTWTACHIDTKYKIVLLYQLIESLMLNNIRKCYVSISFHNKFTMDERYSILNTITLYIRKMNKIYTDSYIILYVDIEKEMSQFEHLNKLFRNFRGKRTEKIIFIDDDDILLSVPKEYLKYNIVAGIQYWPINTQEDDETYKKNYNEIKSLIPTFKNKWKKLTDFSGYMCRYKDLILYFTQIRIKESKLINITNYEKLTKAYNSMEDIIFMKYLDNKGAHYIDTPFIFHRIWQTDDRQIQTWKQNLI